MERSTPYNYQDPLPPFPSPSQSFDLSPLEFILVLFAVIMVPSFIYTLFLFIKCRPEQHRDSAELHPSSDDGGKDRVSKLINYDKEAHFQNIGGDCPVCLSSFADGDEIRQLSLCNHAFHASCIDLWLGSHSNCPVCRAEVKGFRNRTRPAGHHDDDFRQGLPDSATLI